MKVHMKVHYLTRILKAQKFFVGDENLKVHFGVLIPRRFTRGLFFNVEMKKKVKR